MQHRPAFLRSCGTWLARRKVAGLAALAFAAGACGDARGTLVVLSDTTSAPPWRVVVALPFDPARLPIIAEAPIPDSPRGDSVRLALARHDSVGQADAAFQRARTKANDAARELAALDRTSDDYERRYAAWRRLADSAESIRSSRDRVSQRLRALTDRLGPDAPVASSAARLQRSRKSADSAGRAMGQELVFATLRNGSATVELPPGDWWLAKSVDDRVVLPAQHISIVSDAVDTISLGDGN